MCQVRSCGAQVLYVDTDSILMLVPRQAEEVLGISKSSDPFQTVEKDPKMLISSVIFGHWKDECPLGLYIAKFLGLRYDFLFFNMLMSN